MSSSASDLVTAADRSAQMGNQLRLLVEVDGQLGEHARVCDDGGEEDDAVGRVGEGAVCFSAMYEYN